MGLAWGWGAREALWGGRHDWLGRVGQLAGARALPAHFWGSCLHRSGETAAQQAVLASSPANLPLLATDRPCRKTPQYEEKPMAGDAPYPAAYPPSQPAGYPTV